MKAEGAAWLKVIYDSKTQLYEHYKNGKFIGTFSRHLSLQEVLDIDEERGERE